MIICQRLLNSRETDVTQIRSNTCIERIHLSTLSLLIVALLHFNQRMLTCSTVRTKYSWQNDWSQGFWLCDQEELPYCDTCVKEPYQSHIWYSYLTWIFCRGVSGFATDCPCGVWCRGLTTCLLHVGPPFGNWILNNSWAVGLTALFKATGTMLQSDNQMPYRDEYHLQVLKSPRMSVTSMMEMLWSTKFHEKLSRLMSHFVESILSM